MPGKGFLLRKLSLSGDGVPEAEVEMAPGLNVITGPSDTGKTYIAQCIDFMLGARRPPKEIPQAASYSRLQLDLLDRETREPFSLQRSLRGGEFTLLDGDGHSRTLSAQHVPGSEDTVSHFLNSLCGLSGRKVRSNQRGTTRDLSFRDICRLIMVTEENVITG